MQETVSYQGEINTISYQEHYETQQGKRSEDLTFEKP